VHFTKTIANKATSNIFPLLHTFFEIELVEKLGRLFALDECIGSFCKGKHPNQALGYSHNHISVHN
jgi:hypothetical protein